MSVLRRKYDTLLAILRKQKRLLIAFSGGCDSTFLLATARTTLGKENVLAVTAVSASLAAQEKESAQALAEGLDVPFLGLNTDELENPAYVANPSNRCFFCKDELFGKLAPLAAQHSMRLADGFNASDRSDFRPGFQASQKWHVIHPLNDADLTKHDIRVLSRWRGLATWRKPASPCLSSRIPYGTPVTNKILRQIEFSESLLHEEGFRIVRVRHFGNEARIEVPLKDLARLQEPDRWARIAERVRSVGYEQVVADIRGFKSGRLNEKAPSLSVRSTEIP